MAPEPIQSNEELREALLGLRREHEALQASSVETQHLLDALESLLGLADQDDPFLRVFAALRKVFTFSKAMMLSAPAGAAATGTVPGGDSLECIVAEPAALIGSSWPLGPSFRKVLDGRVVATLSTEGTPEWSAAQRLGLSPQQSALYVPVRVRDRRGILVLLRPADAAGFDRSHVALGRRLSLLVSHALATRYASQSAAESQRLLDLTRQLRQSEQAAQRSAALLQQIVGSLPLGLAVQDAQGRLTLINDAAAKLMGRHAEGLLGSLPFERGSPAKAQWRRERFQLHLANDAQRSVEREVRRGAHISTYLLTSKPVQVADERLLVTAALDISDRKRFEQELSRRAFYDELTGLPNRALIEQRVNASLSGGQRSGQFALAFIDLDNFKQVNDFYSHAIGDALLRAVADRLRQHLRPGDSVARISGDEFLLLIDPLQRPQDLHPIIERVVELLKQPFQLEGHEVLTSASVGASIYPLHGSSYETLRRSADNAMYRAKSDRKGSAQYFDPAMGSALTARMALEQLLRTAVREQRFRAALQPKVDIASGAVLGFEALIRWVDADGSIRMPGSFIGLATELGLLDQLTHVVLDDVIALLPTLRQHYGSAVSVSVNIGARQAGDIDFMRTVTARMAGGVGHSIVLELTEEALVAATRFQGQVLPRLREMGVRVSVDDFGTGYSSLSTLSDVIADEVKVDRAFITQVQDRPRSQGILRAIESLCTALQIDMVAEGVETQAELDYLRQHSRIRCAQGYLFARPAFIEDLLAQRLAGAATLIAAPPAKPALAAAAR